MHNVTFFGWRPASGVVGGGSFRLPHDLFRSTLLYSVHFSLPTTICFKNRTFSLRVSRESPVEIRSIRFFRLTYVETKHQSDEHNQAGTNGFQLLIWIFWVCQLSPTCYNTDCSQLMSLFDRYQLQLVYPTVEHHPVRNLQHETSQTTFDMFDQSQHLLHTLPKPFFAFQLRFYLSWNKETRYAKNVAFFFHLHFKMATHKFTSFDKFF